MNSGDATILLGAVEKGDPKAADQLLSLLYEELRRLARNKMSREAPGQTLQPTALVHEAWLRLMGPQPQTFANRAHFFSAAAEAMRRILIDRARRRLSGRHGGGLERIDVESVDIAGPDSDELLLGIHEMLDRLAKEHPEHAEVVKLRYFVGLTNEEIAQTLGISASSVKNYWTFSRAWIFRAMQKS